MAKSCIFSLDIKKPPNIMLGESERGESDPRVHLGKVAFYH